MQSKKSNMAKPAVIAGAVVLVVLGALFGLPVMSAGMWKSSTLDTVNESITVISKTNMEITQAGSKLQPTEADYEKAITAYTSQLAAAQKAQKAIGEVQAYGIDALGEVSKATDTRTKLLEAYSELAAQAATGKAQATSDKAVTKSLGSINASTSLESSLALLKSAATQLENDAKSGLNKSYNTRFAAAVRNFVSIIDKYSKGLASEAEVNAASAKIDSFVNEGTELTNKLQKESDATIDKLNAAAKELE